MELLLWQLCYHELAIVDIESSKEQLQSMNIDSKDKNVFGQVNFESPKFNGEKIFLAQ